MLDPINILGISGSLRTSRRSFPLENLPQDRNNFVGLLESFSQLKIPNSELSLLAALWGAQQEGAATYHLNLADFQSKFSTIVSLLKKADGVIISSPVYFGANSSLIQRFSERLKAEPFIEPILRGKLYSGLAAAAKRNGGQETTLIYQMADMLGLGFLGVGNSPLTTCQYGGTVVAGDKGALINDKFGLETCIGVGRRIAQAASMYAVNPNGRLPKNLNVDFWILQDQNRTAETLLQPLLSILTDQKIAPHCYRIYDHEFKPCQACDRCPHPKGRYGEYRCRIKDSKDGIKILHHQLVNSDVIIPTFFSPLKRDNLKIIHQQFMERTRYLRRGDYVLSNRVVIPLLFYELGRHEHLDMKVITSFIRHHTIIHQPVIAVVDNGRIVNPNRLLTQWKYAVKASRRMAAGRYLMQDTVLQPNYVPIGYVNEEQN